MSTTFARRILMLFRMIEQMELKSEVDATGMNLGRNVISFLNLEQY